MPLLGRRYRVLLPVVFVCAHLLLIGIAEVQYRTGWLHDPPNVTFDPPHLPLAERAAIYLNLPAVALSFILFRLIGATVEGLGLLLLATPFVSGFWLLVGKWLDVWLPKPLSE